MDNWLEEVNDLFAKELKKNKLLSLTIKRANNGAMSQTDAYNLTNQLSDIASKCLKKVINTDELSELSSSEMTNALVSIIEPYLTNACNMVNSLNYNIAKQNNVNNGLGLNPLNPGLQSDRIRQFAQEIAEADDLEEALDSFPKNALLSTTDKFIEENADADYSSGYEVEVVRECEPNACEWCQSLAGTYNYEDVRDKGNDVWRRHVGCLCTIDVHRVETPNKNSSFLRGRIG